MIGQLTQNKKEQIQLAAAPGPKYSFFFFAISKEDKLIAEVQRGGQRAASFSRNKSYWSHGRLTRPSLLNAFKSFSPLGVHKQLFSQSAHPPPPFNFQKGIKAMSPLFIFLPCFTHYQFLKSHSCYTRVLQLMIMNPSVSCLEVCSPGEGGM